MKATAYNVAALDKVLGLATKIGDSYKPGNPSIELTALTALLEESQKSVTAVIKAEGDLATAINHRQDAFGILPALGTEILHMAESCGMNKKDLQDLDKIRKRFRSQPFKGTAQKTSPGGQAGQQNNTEASEASTETPARKNRQLSFDNKVLTFESIISFLESKPCYQPTEPDFTICGLKGKLMAFQRFNDGVNDAKARLVESRQNCKVLVFHPESGIWKRARMTKRYVRTIAGKKSDLFKSMNRIKFVK